MRRVKKECRDLFGVWRIQLFCLYVKVSELTGRAIRKARTYLEEDIHLLEDMYELALVAYALQITESPRVGEVINKLNAKATVKGGGDTSALLFISEM